MPSSSARLAVFVSGSGRTLERLLQVTDRGELPASIALVVASRECRGAEIGREHGIPTEIIQGDLSAAQLLSLVDAHSIDVVVLAGYLRKVPVPLELEGRIVNIHPALLPRFGGDGMYGHRVHEAVLEAAKAEGLTESGCTVHLCNDAYDDGDILMQVRCPIHDDDTPDTLAARVFELEKVAYPVALRKLISDLKEARPDR